MRGVLFTIFAFAGVALIGPGMTGAQVIYVDDDATGAADGSSWEDAYTDLKDALEASDSGEIWVAEGTYRPAGAGGSRSATFQLASGVALYGGFAGDETARSGRDPQLHETILSGDLDANDEPAWVNHSENSQHIVTGSGTDASAILDGFTIIGGYATDASGMDSSGAGVLIDAGDPTIEHCIIASNLAHNGPGLLVLSGSPVIADCTFRDNYAWQGRGGGIYVASGGTVVVEGTLFLSNRAYGASSIGDGGAVFLESDCTFTATGCRFQSNVSETIGAIYPVGGAIASLADDVTIESCVFTGNRSVAGGAIWSAGDRTVIANCAFSGNAATVGGALACFVATTTVVGSTFAGNDATDGGGIANGLLSTITIENCVLWGNSGDADSAYGNQIHNDGADVTFGYSCVEGVFTAAPGEDPPDPENFPGCTEDDPLLADGNGADNIFGTVDDDLRLSADSPCIDAGDNDAHPALFTNDLDAHPRFHDDPDVADTGNGTAPIIDMGAYEFGSVVPPAPELVRGDCNMDGVISLLDPIYDLKYQFLSGPTLCLDAHDANDDGRIGLADPIYTLRYQFVEGAEPPAPFPGCGIDETADDDADLGCENSGDCP